MQFLQIRDDHLNLVTGYSSRHIAINGQSYQRSLLVRPHALLPGWPVNDIRNLLLQHLTGWIDPPPEILLVGTGTHPHLPSREIRRQCAQLPYGVEFMTTSAACRTYNLITAEGRAVAAALILDGSDLDGSDLDDLAVPSS
jgi:uncharacterized protein